MEGNLYLPMLPDIARQVPIFPNINNSLLFIGSLFDAGCTVNVKIKYIIVIYKDEIIPRGWGHQQNKLWYFPLSVKNEDGHVGEEESNLVNNVYKQKMQA